MNTRESTEAHASNITMGAVKCLAEIAAIFTVGMIILTVAANTFDWWTDDSDINGWNRSGLRVHTDHKTGVQYLSDGHGGLIVRDKGGSK